MNDPAETLAADGDWLESDPALNVAWLRHLEGKLVAANALGDEDDDAAQEKASQVAAAELALAEARATHIQLLRPEKRAAKLLALDYSVRLPKCFAALYMLKPGHFTVTGHNRRGNVVYVGMESVEPGALGTDHHRADVLSSGGLIQVALSASKNDATLYSTNNVRSASNDIWAMIVNDPSVIKANIGGPDEDDSMSVWATVILITVLVVGVVSCAGGIYYAKHA